MSKQREEDEEKGLTEKDLFDQSQYNTILLSGDTFKSPSQEHANLIAELLTPGLQRAELEERFDRIRKEKLGKLLIDHIQQEQSAPGKAKLLAACWESGLDFTGQLLFFSSLVCHDDFQVALEALTVAESIERAGVEELREVQSWLSAHAAPHAELAKHLQEHLESLH